MTLATHAIAGAALATTMPTRPVLVFAAGFASHFLLDAIPHWDYPLDNGMFVGRPVYLDLIKIAGDGLLGLVVSWLLFHSWVGMIAALGAILPDALQFAYFKLRGPILTPLQRFHMWIHTDHRLKNRPMVGVFSQVLLVILIVWLTAGLR